MPISACGVFAGTKDSDPTPESAETSFELMFHTFHVCFVGHFNSRSVQLPSIIENHLVCQLGKSVTQ
jgi:hypothetical protein